MSKSEESDTSNPYERLSPEQIETLALPYYGPRFWNKLSVDMGNYSSGAAAKWRQNGIKGKTKTAFLKALEAKRVEVKDAQSKADKLLRKIKKHSQHTGPSD